jgi:hypothetical protein
MNFFFIARRLLVYAWRIPLLAVAFVAGSALAAEPPKSDIDMALAKAKKDKKLVTLVFTQFG